MRGSWRRSAATRPSIRTTCAGRSSLARQMLLDFFRQRSDGLANAPPSLVNEIVARHRLLLRLLAKDDVPLCADLANNFLIGRFDLPAFYQDRATSLSALIVEAAKEGEKIPRDPARSGLGSEDATRWYEELLRVRAGERHPGGDRRGQRRSEQFAGHAMPGRRRDLRSDGESAARECGQRRRLLPRPGPRRGRPGPDALIRPR